MYRVLWTHNIAGESPRAVWYNLSPCLHHTPDFEHNFSEIFKDKDPVSNVLLADLDDNGFDEIYIITTSAGSGSCGNVLGFASNKDKSLSMIHFPEIQESDPNFKGYMGHDAFTIEDRKTEGLSYSAPPSKVC